MAIELKWEWQKNWERWVTKVGLFAGEINIVKSGDCVAYVPRLRLHYLGGTLNLFKVQPVYDTPELAQSAAEDAINQFATEFEKAREDES